MPLLSVKLLPIIPVKFLFIKLINRQFSIQTQRMKIESIPIKKETEQNFKKLMEMVQPDDSLALADARQS